MLDDVRPIDRVIARVKAVYSGWGRSTTAAQMRDDWDRLFGSDVRLALARHEEINGVPVAWIGTPDVPRCPVIVYLHGGGYQVGSVRSHLGLISRLGAESGLVALAVSYRCAPEHTFPAPIEDCERVYEALLESGVVPEDIAFVGDSAGGNLALALVLKLQSSGKPAPGAIGLMSPWTDLEARGESYETRAETDPIHQRAMILRMARIYLGGADASQPLASPLNGDLEGFPPVFIQVGDCETVLSDACNLATRLDAAGVEVTCQIWPEMIHVFQQFPDDLPEAGRAIADMAAFLKEKIGQRRGAVHP